MRQGQVSVRQGQAVGAMCRTYCEKQKMQKVKTDMTPLSPIMETGIHCYPVAQKSIMMPVEELLATGSEDAGSVSTTVASIALTPLE